jgi:uncharacterized repeat protein (TIGR01451 family)
VPSGFVNTGTRPLAVTLTAGQAAAGRDFFAQAEHSELTLDKTSPDAAYDSVGDVLSYSYKLTNAGNVPMSGPFVVNDDHVTVS